MKQIDFYLDFISPYAYLAFEKLPEALAGLDVAASYKPVLFAALLKHHGQLGPAEIDGKRDWTFRQVQWLARSSGVELQLPAAHPFNPLPLSRLAVAARTGDSGDRAVCAAVFDHIWRGGGDATDPDRLAALRTQVAPIRDPDDDSVKAEFRANTEEAIARGVFGVPTFVVDDRLFWGFDSLPMLRAYLCADAWFAGDAWDAATRVRVGVRRGNRA